MWRGRCRRLGSCIRSGDDFDRWRCNEERRRCHSSHRLVCAQVCPGHPGARFRSAPPNLETMPCLGEQFRFCHKTSQPMNKDSGIKADIISVVALRARRRRDAVPAPSTCLLVEWQAGSCQQLADHIKSQAILSEARAAKIRPSWQQILPWNRHRQGAVHHAWYCPVYRRFTEGSTLFAQAKPPAYDAPAGAD